MAMDEIPSACRLLVFPLIVPRLIVEIESGELKTPMLLATPEAEAVTFVIMAIVEPKLHTPKLLGASPEAVAVTFVIVANEEVFDTP